MSGAQWAPGARSAYLRFLRELAVLSPPAAQRAEDDVLKALSIVTDHPLRGRASQRWLHRREWSLRRQHKLLVYRQEADGVVVVGFFDTRQDLNAIDFPED